MKFKSIVMAAVLAAGVAGSAIAQENVENGGFNGGLGDWSFSSPINLGASLAGDVGVVDTSLFSGPGAILQVLRLEVGRYAFSFDGLFSGRQSSSLFASIFNSDGAQLIQMTFSGSDINGFKSDEFNVAEGGLFGILFVGTSNGRLGSFVAVDNVSVAPLAVPGPEAGAGLAGLAMAGMYVWASRRRKAQNAA